MVTGPDTAQTLSRGLQVLERIAADPQGRTLGQLAAELGLSRTIVGRLVNTLLAHGLIRRADDGVLTVGLGVLALVRHVHPALGERSRELLQRLAEATGATAHLAVADGAESVAVAVIEPRSTPYHIAYRVGSRLPVEAGALGRAILSARAGRREVMISTGEIIPGATGIAASVVGIGIPAAIGVVAAHELDMSIVGPLVSAAAEELSGSVAAPVASPSQGTSVADRAVTVYN